MPHGARSWKPLWSLREGSVKSRFKELKTVGRNMDISGASGEISGRSKDRAVGEALSVVRGQTAWLDCFQLLSGKQNLGAMNLDI